MRERQVMGTIRYITNVSLDGFIEDRAGEFAWTEPDDEVFAYTTDLLRPMAVHLYGRRLYETMAVWETDPSFAAMSDLMADFAYVWSDADKVVYSHSLEVPVTDRTRVERRLDPDAVRDLKASTDGELLVGGAEVAAQMLEANLVDEIEWLVRPVLVGGGKPALPGIGRIDLELTDERRFESGIVSLRYRVVT